MLLVTLLKCERLFTSLKSCHDNFKIQKESVFSIEVFIHALKPFKKKKKSGNWGGGGGGYLKILK
jgi:hypothetical protein